MSPNIDFVFWPAPIRHLRFRDHVAAAVAGGFSSVAISPITYLDEVAHGQSARDLRDYAEGNGVPVRHLDSLTGWAPSGKMEGYDDEMRARYMISLDQSIQICKEMGIESILACAAFEAGTVPHDVVVKGFADLCRLAGDLGIWVDLEPMPFLGVPDLQATLAILDAVDAPNTGIVLDTWHFSRGNPDFALLRSLLPGKITTLQISDALYKLQAPTMMEDTLRFRRFAGEGELPITAILEVLREKGGLTRAGAEVFSDVAATLSPTEAGRKSALSMRSAMELAGFDLCGSTLFAG
ncbi:sugar phosphate isomerase/epimerase family protein [Paraburkholderia phymatum]|uniref:sugar phosphate isomerase/epimerase family protein n=1 Tax=Paraburkholderia phymatum TaxID=148447 RepID=UPI0031785D5F